jgi:hypothetical protein
MRRRFREGAGGEIATVADQESSPPRPPRSSILTYRPGESAAALVARIRAAEEQRRLDDIAAIPSYDGGLSLFERRATVERLRRAH